MKIFKLLIFKILPEVIFPKFKVLSQIVYIVLTETTLLCFMLSYFIDLYAKQRKHKRLGKQMSLTLLTHRAQLQGARRCGFTSMQSGHQCLVAVLVFNCCVTNWQKGSRFLKQHILVISQMLWVGSLGQVSWIFCAGSHKAKTKTLASYILIQRLHKRKTSFKFTECQQNLFSCGRMPEITVFLLPVNQVLPSTAGGHTQSLATWLSAQAIQNGKRISQVLNLSLQERSYFF